MIADPASDPNGKPVYVVESFNIAVYLDKTYPAPKYPAVFSPGTRALQRVASEAFTNEVGYALMPVARPLVAKPGFLDDRGCEYFCRTRRVDVAKIPDMIEAGSKKWDAIHELWDNFGKQLDVNVGTEDEGPFVMGKQISFTDFAIGGMFHWIRRAEGGEMLWWGDMAKWQDGRWARLWAEIEKLEKDSTEVVA